MKKLIIGCSALLISGCATSWKPVYDPRSAENPREIIRDELECKELMKVVDNYNGVPVKERYDIKLLGFLPYCYWDCDGMFDLPLDYNPMKNCMEARGHKVINWDSR
jgi:hypothetical protein